MTKLPKMKRYQAERVHKPSEELLLLTTGEIAAVQTLAEERYGQENAFDYLTAEDISQLLKEAYGQKRVQELPVTVPDEEGTLQRWVENLVKDIEAVGSDGRLDFFSGEAHAELFSHNAIMRSLREAHQRGVRIRLLMGPVLSVTERDDVRYSGVLELVEEGVIELYRRPLRETREHYRLMCWHENGSFREEIRIEAKHKALEKLSNRRVLQPGPIARRWWLWKAKRLFSTKLGIVVDPTKGEVNPMLVILEEKKQLYRDAGLMFLLLVLIAHVLMMLLVGPWNFGTTFAIWLFAICLGTAFYGFWVIRKDKELLRQTDDKDL